MNIIDKINKYLPEDDKKCPQCKSGTPSKDSPVCEKCHTSNNGLRKKK